MLYIANSTCIRSEALKGGIFSVFYQVGSSTTLQCNMINLTSYRQVSALFDFAPRTETLVSNQYCWRIHSFKSPLCPIIMAANFWSSSHYKTLLDPEYVDVVHSLDKDRGITVEDFKLIKMHMANYIVKLANQIKVRQRVVATAITYMRRVYTSKSMTEYEPRLVAPTCLYLASKSEETTVQAKVVHYYMKRIYTDEKYRYEIKHILEMEMKILEALDYYLVVFHPYHSLTELLQDAEMGDKESVQLTWGLLNDTYKMDLILIHPPHIISLACIFIASVFKEKDTVMWFEELHVDMNAVKTIAMEILDFYDSIKTNTEERITTALTKLPTRQ